MSRLDDLYAKLPTWAQHVATSAYGVYWHWLRFGPGYRDQVAAYEGRERLVEAEWSRWQAERLRVVLGVAAAHVPHYRERWSDAQKQAARAGSLAELPLLEKEPVRADPRSFVRQDVTPRFTPVFHTSGSTGTPIQSIWTVDEVRASLAVREARSARWAGTSFRLPRATFSGRQVVPDPDSKGPYHRFNAVERQVYLSAFHLKPETAASYVQALADHGVRWLTGYSVSYYLLAKLILEQGIDVPPLRAVITTSERLSDSMRRVMEQAYRCPVYQEYSTVENVLFASECRERRLHVSPEVGLIEILRPDGSPADPGEQGEVVATSLLRAYQPMVRFRLGDTASWDPDPCPCGRQLPVLREVLGRIEDVIVGPDGRQLVRFHGVFLDLPHVREGQVVQERRDRILLRVVPGPEYDAKDEQELIRRVRARLGEVQVSVEHVPEIPRTPAGKFQAVVSLLEGTETTGA